MILKKTLIVCGATALWLSSCVSLQSQQLDSKDVKKQKTETSLAPNALVIFDKTNAKKENWYACTDGKPAITIEEGCLKASFVQAMGDCFGIFFDPIDVSTKPVIKVKVKYKAGTSANTDKQVELLAGFTDASKNKTYFPLKNVLVKENSGFIEYLFDYNIESKNKNENFDYSKVNSILFFINITGTTNISGEISIEEIALIKPTK